MTTLSKEDVVRIDNELLAMIQKHFPSLPLDDRYTDWKKWLCFARAVYSHGEQAARAGLVAENERLKAWEESSIQACAKVESCYVSNDPAKTFKLLESWWFGAGMEEQQTVLETSLIVELRDQLTATRTALAAAESDNERLRDVIFSAKTTFDAYASIHKSKNPPDLEKVSFNQSRSDMCAEAIAQPRDDSALREMIAGVYEECAKLSDSYAYMSQDFVALSEELRALAEKAKGE